jgi:hypothetical protein
LFSESSSLAGGGGLDRELVPAMFLLAKFSQKEKFKIHINEVLLEVFNHQK